MAPAVPALRFSPASAHYARMEPESRKTVLIAVVRRFAPLVLLVALAIAAHLFGFSERLSLAGLAGTRVAAQDFIASAWAPALALFMAAYAAAVALSFPATGLLTAAGGFLFGWHVGFAAALVSGTLGAGILFLAARSAAGDGVRRRLTGVGERLASGFEADAFGYLVALRLAPVIPSFVVSVSAAFFRVPLRTFLAATLIGRAPAALAYAFLGKGLDDVFAEAAADGRAPGVADLLTPEIVIALGGLSLLALAAVVLRGRRLSRFPRLTG